MGCSFLILPSSRNPWQTFHPVGWSHSGSLGIRRHQGEDAVHQPSVQAGYCSHSSDLFPTWHRAYLAMYEQTVFLQMVSIAKAFPPQYQTRYIKACEGFGIPYWDPFLPRRKILNKYGYSITKCGVPVVLSSKDVRIRTPRQPDPPINAPNPLYSYQFASGDAEWSKVAGHNISTVFNDVSTNPHMMSSTIRGPTPAGSTSHQYINNTLTNAVSTATGPASTSWIEDIPDPSRAIPELHSDGDQRLRAGKWTDDTMNKENSLEASTTIYTPCVVTAEMDGMGTWVLQNMQHSILSSGCIIPTLTVSLPSGKL